MNHVLPSLVFFSLSFFIASCSISHFDAKAWTSSHLVKSNAQASNHNLALKSKSSLSHESNVAENKPIHCVVLIHGLWRSSFAMRSIESYLMDNGYLIENISYPSTEGSIQDLASAYVAPAVDRCNKKAGTVHIVTHSMGGIIAQAFLQKNRLNYDSKVVMLSPPSQGSELAKLYKNNDFVTFFAGEPAMTLHGDKGGVIANFSAFPESLGVIAGYRNWSLWPETLLPTPNDGMVSLQSMITEGMDDLILINTGHAMMRYNTDVKLQILSFLKHGAFDHKNEK